MHRDAQGVTPDPSIALFQPRWNTAQTFYRLLLPGQILRGFWHFVRLRSRRLVLIQTNCAQIPETDDGYNPQFIDGDDGKRWLDCPLCGGETRYKGVEDGHGDYGDSLCDVYRCNECDYEVTGNCIDAGLSN